MNIPKRKGPCKCGHTIGSHLVNGICQTLSCNCNQPVDLRTAYDALAARLAAVEKDRGEAVALLQRIGGSSVAWELGTDLSDHVTAFLARLARTAEEKS